MADRFRLTRLADVLFSSLFEFFFSRFQSLLLIFLSEMPRKFALLARFRNFLKRIRKPSIGFFGDFFMHQQWKIQLVKRFCFLVGGRRLTVRRLRQVKNLRLVGYFDRIHPRISVRWGWMMLRMHEVFG
jgi:hypothetical protein